MNIAQLGVPGAQPVTPASTMGRANGATSAPRANGNTMGSSVARAQSSTLGVVSGGRGGPPPKKVAALAKEQYLRLRERRLALTDLQNERCDALLDQIAELEKALLLLRDRADAEREMWRQLHLDVLAKIAQCKKDVGILATRNNDRLKKFCAGWSADLEDATREWRSLHEQRQREVTSRIDEVEERRVKAAELLEEEIRDRKQQSTATVDPLRDALDALDARIEEAVEQRKEEFAENERRADSELENLRGRLCDMSGERQRKGVLLAAAVKATYGLLNEATKLTASDGRQWYAERKKGVAWEKEDRQEAERQVVKQVRQFLGDFKASVMENITNEGRRTQTILEGIP